MDEYKKGRRDLYQEVTDKIVTSIENGTSPWSRPWTEIAALGLPHNGISKANYHGINTAVLFVTAHENGYPSNEWYTYKQAAEIGANVRKGEKSTPIYYFKMLEVNHKNDEVESSMKTSKTGRDDSRMIPFLVQYNVFNASQIDGLDVQVMPEPKWEPIEALNEIISRLNPDIRYGGNRAFYAPGSGRDYIQMPYEAAFENSALFAGTLCHEIAHWTGAPFRLNRRFGTLGTPEYDREEVRADLASAYICAQLKIPTSLDASASYIWSFVARLKSDKFEVFRAMKDSTRIAEFVTGSLVLDSLAKPTGEAVAQPTAVAVAQDKATPAFKALLAIKPKRATPGQRHGSGTVLPTMAEAAPSM